MSPRFLSEWRLTHTQAGWTNGASFAGHAAAVPVLASLTDSADGRRMYLGGAVATTVATAGFATAATGSEPRWRSGCSAVSAWRVRSSRG